MHLGIKKNSISNNCNLKFECSIDKHLTMNSLIFERYPKQVPLLCLAPNFPKMKNEKPVFIAIVNFGANPHVADGSVSSNQYQC